MTTRKKKLPPKAKIGAHYYDVEWDETLASLGVMGLCSEDNARIHLDPTVHPTMQKDALLHEVLHAVWKQTSLRVRTSDTAPNSDGESIIQDITPLLLGFLRENPEVLAWLLEET